MQVFFSTGLPSFTLLPPLPFVCLHSNLLPPNWNFQFSGLGRLCTDGTLWPHPHNSSDGTFGNDFLFWAELCRTIGQGINACFGGALSALVLSILMKAGVGISFPFGGIGHDLATYKFVEAGTVLDHGVSSLSSRMTDVAVAEALDCRGVGCFSIRGLFRLGINRISPPSALRN